MNNLHPSAPCCSLESQTTAIPSRTVTGLILGSPFPAPAISFFRFKINFKAGHNETVLHINPRLNERTVVRNSFLGGRWGAEEREVLFNPFEPGQYFDVSVLQRGDPLWDGGKGLGLHYPQIVKLHSGTSF